MGRISKELLAVTILLNLAAIGWYGFLFAEVKAKNENTSNLMSRIRTETAEGNTLHSKKALVAETASLRGELASYLVAREGAVSFIEFLETTGDEVGAQVTVESINTHELTQSAQAEELKLALQVTGTWPAVVRFLGLLELLPYKTDLHQVVLSRADPPREDSWQATVLVTVLKEK